MPLAQPPNDALWLLPLGGCGEIGINANLYGHAGGWILVDCGIGFEGSGGAKRVIAPQLDAIAARRDQLHGLLITHAHEDHVGAVAHHWPELLCPVYCSPFTAAILYSKLADAGILDQVPVYEVAEGDTTQHGDFSVRWLPITHSTAESRALLIDTPAGKILHTGDWKLDDDPVVGPAHDEHALRALSREPVLAMVGDSTNATVPGRTPSEGALRQPLLDVVRRCTGRVVVGCFGSNLARLHTLLSVAADSGRYAALLGRSLHRYVGAARASGVWAPLAEPVPAAHLGYLPPGEVMAIATGSQGEPHAALDRLSRRAHRDLDLESGDTVIFSSRVIPGNEAVVTALEERFAALGVQVIDAERASDAGPLHASGHPAQDDLKDMYDWVRPSIAVPVHGEDRHLDAHAALARAAGVPSVLSPRNGDLVQFAPQLAVFRRKIGAGRIELQR